MHPPYGRVRRSADGPQSAIFRTLLVAALLVAGSAGAQDKKAAPPGGGDEKKFGGMVDGRLGLGMIDEDLFLSINVGTVLRWWKLGVGIQVPLRLRIVDNGKKDDSVFRKEDWDEASDWTRVLRFVEWGQPNEWLYARLGVLTGATLGHGTVVDNYYNVIDLDHYQTGVWFHLDTKWAGGDIMLDNLIDPEILALRGYVRPLSFTGAPEWARKLYVGVTVAADMVAPLDPKGAARRVNDDGELEVTAGAATIVGFDIGWDVLSTTWVGLKPYTDLNFLAETGGFGYHLGIMATFRAGKWVTIRNRLEYRVISDDYSPSWFNAWYEVERVDYGNGRTKLRTFRDRDRAGKEGVKHGWHVSLDLTILDAVTITALLEDYQGADNGNLMIRLMLPYIYGVRLAAYYSKRGLDFDRPAEAFDLDRGLLVTDVRWKFWGPMFVFAQYSREWRLDKDRGSANFGKYETIDDWDAGLGVEFAF